MNIKAIQMDGDEIKVESPQELVAEVQERNKTRGNTYVERLIRGKTRLKKAKGWYPEDKKIEVCALFASGVTNSKELEELTGINANTIRAWRAQDWWVDMLEKIHVAHDQNLASSMTKIVDKALEQLQDRIENGDYIHDKYTGEVYRKPLSGRDAATITSVIVDKRQLLRGQPTSRTDSGGSVARLEKLAAEFAKFVKARDVTPEATIENIEVTRES